jgi:hypothetical protein
MSNLMPAVEFVATTQNSTAAIAPSLVTSRHNWNASESAVGRKAEKLADRSWQLEFAAGCGVLHVTALRGAVTNPQHLPALQLLR